MNGVESSFMLDLIDSDPSQDKLNET